MAGAQGYWSCAHALRNSESFRVCEQIRSADGSTYSDLSSWFWSVVFSKQGGPWFAYTIAEPDYH